MTLERATYSQKIERDRLCHGEWGVKLSLEQFLGREERLRELSWARDGMTTWVWLASSGEVLASCETFRMDSYSGGALGSTYGIASVYVEPRLRGKRHASEMLNEVVSTLSVEDAQAHAVILYSEVGLGIYGRLGFVPRPMGERIFKVSDVIENAPLPESFPRARLKKIWSQTPLPEMDYFIWPSLDQLEWHLTRQDIYTEALEKKSPVHCGAIRGESILVWYADHRYDCLRALYFRARSSEDADSLIAAALIEARDLGFREFRVWDSEEAAAPSMRFRQENLDDSVPMIKPLGANVGPDAWAVVSRSMWI